MLENHFLKTIKISPQILKNVTNLSFVEAANVFIPLATVPYLITNLEKEMYGLVIFAQSVSYYFMILQNFGLNTYATKEVSLYSQDKDKVNGIVSGVIYVKAVLFLFNLTIVTVLTKFFPIIDEHKKLFFFSLWICLFDLFFPKWYFQGKEIMKRITYVSLINKMGSLILIVLLVKSQEDYFKVPLIYAFTALIPGLVTTGIVFKKDKIKLKTQKIKFVLKTMNCSSNFFFSEISVAIFANSNKVIIGSLLSMVELAYYDLAEKIIFIFRNTPSTIARDSIFPRVVKTKDLNIVKNTTLIMSVYAVIVVFALFLLAPFLVDLLGGIEMQQSVSIVRLFSIAILTTHISNYYVTVGLWTLGQERTYRNLMLYSSILFALILLLLWVFKSINVYTVTILPIIIDFYLIIHIYYIFKHLHYEHKRNA